MVALAILALLLTLAASPSPVAPPPGGPEKAGEPIILFLIDNSASLPPLDPDEKRVAALEKMFTFLQGQRYRLILFGGRREVFIDDVTRYRNNGQWTDFYFAFEKARELTKGYPEGTAFRIILLTDAIVDPGPDGVLTTLEDNGGTLTAYNLNPAYLSLPVDQLYANVPFADSDHLTWEIQTTRRMSGNWGLQTSYTYTWQKLGVMQTAPYLEQPSFTPNTAINTIDGRHRFGLWGAKAELTLNTWKNLMVVPQIRLQSGPPFSRTFVQRLNYNTGVLIRAEPVGAQRMPATALFDVRMSKSFATFRNSKLGMFFDVYNLFNRNATQELVRSSGSTYLRPSVITSPRIARIGFKFNF
jgi:hypothetical protein